ncbi:BppU family phage baseplate upper protein [Enterococcus avium]|uniref:BppU family phage baseplate upper protein n=2 Tax=Enterococcus avium TaxID=33945 RepID=UPI0022E15272|nr:BppU family phage baseplate upper protein [Enterococcus avium]
MSNIKLILTENKATPYRKQRVVGRLGDGGLTTIDVELLQSDGKTPYAVFSNHELIFVGTNAKGEYTDGVPEILDGQKGIIRYTFTKENFSVLKEFKRAYFQLTDAEGSRVTFQDFTVDVLNNSDIDQGQVTLYVRLLDQLLADFEKRFGNQSVDFEERFKVFLQAKDLQYQNIYQMYNDLVIKLDKLSKDTKSIQEMQAEILKSIEEHDVFTKQESSANVIDQIGGAESTILKKELLVNGTEGMASRFVKDLPYTNIILNGDFKNGITNWSYHQPAGNLSEFVDDVVHAKSNNGTVTGVFQPSDQRLKYGYSTKANEKFFFYALAKGTGIIQLGFDKKRGSATLTQNYTWVGVESTGTTDNEVMTFYTTGEMWIKAIIVSKSEIMNIESFYPAAEDVGVVHGQPNLRNGTSSTLSEVTFIQTQYKETNLVVSNLFKPNDLVTYAVQIDNTAGTADVFAQLACKKSDNTYVSFNGSSVLKGSIGRSMVQVTVLEEYTNIYVKPLVKSNSTISTTVRYGEEKLINGSLEAMDEWTPSQADSGLTPINGGMVPFNEKDYEDLLSDDGIVRAETKIVGRGAEIETPFKIIEVFANRYPDIFGKTTTDAEKITCFKSIQKGVTIKSTLRGSGANASKNGQLYLKYTDGTSEFLVNNQTSEFVEISKTLTATQLDQLSSTGVLTVYATTKRNGTNDAGAISDGVTSALLEVKDLRLIVEIEANGKTIIESIIAANHIENIATEEEAEAGENNEKTMTPLRVFQAIAKWTKDKFVSRTENETVLGVKNFANGLQVGGNNVLTQNGEIRFVTNSTNNSSLESGSIVFKRYGDDVDIYANFQVRASGDLTRDMNIVAESIVDDIFEPGENFSFFVGNETAQAVVKFVGKGIKAHSTLTKGIWYVGTASYKAKNKL